MKNTDVEICNLIESKMNEIILAINQTYSIFESDKLHNELDLVNAIENGSELFMKAVSNRYANMQIVRSLWTNGNFKV